MAIEKMHNQVVAAIRQAINDSGVDLSAISQDRQQKLVDTIADKVMITVNDLLDAEQPTESPSEAGGAEGEQELWKGHPFLSLVEHYVITSERVKIIKGMLSRGVENFELIRIQDIDMKQGISERMMGIGDIVIRGQDPSNPEIILRNIPKPDEVYETLRRAWLDARKRYGLQFREYM